LEFNEVDIHVYRHEDGHYDKQTDAGRHVSLTSEVAPLSSLAL